MAYSYVQITQINVIEAYLAVTQLESVQIRYLRPWMYDVMVTWFVYTEYNPVQFWVHPPYGILV